MCANVQASGKQCSVIGFAWLVSGAAALYTKGTSQPSCWGDKKTSPTLDEHANLLERVY